MTNVNEIVWKDIIGFNGHYQVSNDGQIKSVARFRKGINGQLQHIPQRILKPSTFGERYLKVTLCLDDKLYYRTIHRLVAIHYVNNPLNLPFVNHLDGNKRNNNDWNLEWTDHDGNMKHAVQNRLIPRGEKAGSILSDKEIHFIRTSLTHLRINEIAKMYKMNYYTMWDIVKQRKRS